MVVDEDRHRLRIGDDVRPRRQRRARGLAGDAAGDGDALDEAADDGDALDPGCAADEATAEAPAAGVAACGRVTTK